MKIYILGHKGMLGRYLYTHFMSLSFKVEGISREDIDITTLNKSQLRSWLSHRGVEKNDVIINCIGTIKPMVDKHGTLNAIRVNSVFPHWLSNICEDEGYKMIHITTDCVFSGNDGKYNEKSLHDCTDVYGKSKSLGEPENCTVVRTSIIGEEISNGRSLVEWVKSMKDKQANGFTNHEWNGLTCLEVARLFTDIILFKNFWKGVRHVYSPSSVNKYVLLNIISDIYDLNIDVQPVEAKTKCDRTLSSIYTDVNFNVQTITGQIIEMLEYQEILFSKEY